MWWLFLMFVGSAWPGCGRWRGETCHLLSEHNFTSKQSYFAKPDVKAKFIEFVDASRAPNGRCNEGECFIINAYATDSITDVRPLLQSYEAAGASPAVAPVKMAHPQDMYGQQISRDCRLDVLPPFIQQPVFGAPVFYLSSLLQQHWQWRITNSAIWQSARYWLGHMVAPAWATKNMIWRWAEGRTTRCGCPIHHNVQYSV